MAKPPVLVKTRPIIRSSLNDGPDWKLCLYDMPTIGQGIASTQNCQKAGSVCQFYLRGHVRNPMHGPVDVARLLPSLRSSHDHHDTLSGAQIDQRLIILDGTRTRSAWRPALQNKLNRKDGAMKLNSVQLERTMSQFEVQALPDNHPAVPELNELFGEHTFLLDSNGLNILEPAEESPRGGVQAAKVVNLANWSGDNLTKLAPHEPQPTGAIVELPMSRH